MSEFVEITKTAETYLEDYGAPLNRYLTSLPNDLSWSCCVCVPCYKEGAEVIALHNSLELAAKTHRVQSTFSQSNLQSNSRSHFKPLIIYNINQHADDRLTQKSPEKIDGQRAEVRTSNEGSWQALVTRSQRKPIGTAMEAIPLPYWQSSCQRLQLFRGSNCDMLLVDSFREGRELASGEGVGQARKVAVDLAVRLYAMERVLCPFIYNTDADATVPRDYFTSVSGRDPERTGALIHPFRHVDTFEAENSKASVDGRPYPAKVTVAATAAYEKYLLYYVEGLAYAGSPYAFPTIGSTIIVSILAYCQVRGFPNRMAGEDFYLLNKIAKVSEIVSLIKTPLNLQSRSSDRVPFGTGAAVTKIVSQYASVADYQVYDPRSFVVLKALIATLDELPDQKVANSKILESTTLESKLTSCLGDAICSVLKKEKQGVPFTGNSLPRSSDDVAQQIIADLKIVKGVKSALASSPKPAIQHRHIHHYFDAFLTMKFMHRLRDLVLPAVAWQTALSEWRYLHNSQSTLQVPSP